MCCWVLKLLFLYSLHPVEQALLEHEDSDEDDNDIDDEDDDDDGWCIVLLLYFISYRYKS